jgi:hypothetical protein
MPQARMTTKLTMLVMLSERNGGSLKGVPRAAACEDITPHGPRMTMRQAQPVRNQPSLRCQATRSPRTRRTCVVSSSIQPVKTTACT